MMTGKCGFAEDCEKWKTECKQCPKLREYPASLFLDFTKLMFNKKKKKINEISKIYFTAPTRWLANRMSQSIIKDKSVDVVPNPIDLNIFKNNNNKILKESLNLDKNSFIVLTVGADLMSKRKGGNWILELAKKNINENIIFIMVGAYNIKEKVSKNIKIIPYIKDKKLLAEYYSTADIFLLRSIVESFSMVCGESLACGTPVIGFDSGAPKDVVESAYGNFVKYGDIEKLNLLLHDVKNKKILFKDASDCHKFVKNKFSLDLVLDKYLEVYKKCANEKN